LALQRFQRRAPRRLVSRGLAAPGRSRRGGRAAHRATSRTRRSLFRRGRASRRGARVRGGVGLGAALFLSGVSRTDELQALVQRQEKRLATFRVAA
jgi:hypothetical protein